MLCNLRRTLHVHRFKRRYATYANHHIRDRTFQEDACLPRPANGPSNRAMCNNIALALIFHQGRFESMPQVLRYFNLNRKEAFTVLLSPI